MTTKIAKRVTLDLNDSKLLVDEDRSVTEQSNKTLQKMDPLRNGRTSFSKGLSQRYNISNDEAYDLLKENHQSKVRSTLGNLAVSHSMPALRLQWPYVSLDYAQLCPGITCDSQCLVQNQAVKAGSEIIPSACCIFFEERAYLV